MLWQSLVKIVELKHELDVVLSMFAKEACKVLSVDACSVFILDETEHTYTLSASTLVPTLRSGMIYISAKDDLLGKVALREEALIITDMSKASSYSVLQTLSRKRLQSLLAAPVVHKGDVIGICVAALIISFFATIYPALRGASIKPAEGLRYE